MTFFYWGSTSLPCCEPGILDTGEALTFFKRILEEHLDGLEKNDFCDFEKPGKRACQKGKIESNEQSKEEGPPKQAFEKERDASQSRKPWKSRL